MPTRTIIADDHKLFRKGLIAQLEHFDEIVICGEAQDGSEAYRLIVDLQPDVVLLDLQMPVLNGYEVISKLKENDLNARIIIITSFADDWHVAKAIEAGAAGCLTKDCEPEEVLMAIQSVMDNGFYFNDNTSRSVINNLMKKKKFLPVFRKNGVEFNEKEQTVLYLICNEYSNAEIAQRLFLSERTIEDIRKKMIYKAGAKNMIGMIVYAAQNGIIDLDNVDKDSRLV
jgi:DNA-binding NarL/FixJ family response regulator